MVIDFDSRYCTLILNKLKTQIFFLEKPDLRANQVFPLVFDGLRVKGYKVKIISINTASINTLRSSDVRAEGFLYKDHFMKEVMREHQELDVDDKIFLVNFLFEKLHNKQQYCCDECRYQARLESKRRYIHKRMARDKLYNTRRYNVTRLGSMGTNTRSHPIQDFERERESVRQELKMLGLS